MDFIMNIAYMHICIYSKSEQRVKCVSCYSILPCTGLEALRSIASSMYLLIHLNLISHTCIM